MFYLVLTWLFLFVFQLSHVLVPAQQAYVNNKQLDCYRHYNSTDGNICNGVSSSCLSYLTFRSTPPYYNSPTSIGYLLGSSPELIASANEIPDVEIVQSGKEVIVPINCSCSGLYYQHNASYRLKFLSETYFTMANYTYQGLTTCQALMSQNKYGDRNLTIGLDLMVPLRCACPTSNQTASGFRYLLSYLVNSGDTISGIAEMFGVHQQSVLDANELSSQDLIFPYTPILVPLKQQPRKIQPLLSPPPPPPSNPLPPPPTKSNKKWVVPAVAVGVAVIAAVLLGLVWFSCGRSRLQNEAKDTILPTSSSEATTKELSTESKLDSRFTKDEPWPVTTEGIHYAIDSLTVYKLEDLERATENFNQEKRIMGTSVYKAVLNGDAAAVKVVKGEDISSEINILKRINHSNIIRLSGICSHVKNGNTYLVYEFAENGSLDDWLHGQLDGSVSSTLTWKQRVQIAYDMADALNYLHNYTSPPYIHKNLTSSNVLLDGNMRAKVSNFGLARTLGSAIGLVEGEEEEGVRAQMTRHVIGKQGYMAPEYIENGVITPKLDVFAFGIVLLELLSGKEAVLGVGEKKNGEKEMLLSAYISQVLEGDDVREKLKSFMDPKLEGKYPFDLAFSVANLAKECVGSNLSRRPAMPGVFITLSKTLSTSLDWDPSIDCAAYDSDSEAR